MRNLHEPRRSFAGGADVVERPLNGHAFGDAADMRKFDAPILQQGALDGAPPERHTFMARGHLRFHVCHFCSRQIFDPAVMRQNLSAIERCRRPAQKFFHTERRFAGDSSSS